MSVFDEMDKGIKDLYDTMDNAIKRLKQNEKKMKSYHNTTSESGQSLIQFEMKAKNQDEAVLWVFEKPTIATLTPEMCLTYLQANNPEKYGRVPVTSIRRSFSNLSNDGIIEKTGNMVNGDYGRPTNVWKLVK